MITDESELIPKWEKVEDFRCLLTGVHLYKMYFINKKYGPFIDPCIASTYLRNANHSGFLKETVFYKLRKLLEDDCNGPVETLDQLTGTMEYGMYYVYLEESQERALTDHIITYIRFDHLKVTIEDYLSYLKPVKTMMAAREEQKKKSTAGVVKKARKKKEPAPIKASFADGESAPKQKRVKNTKPRQTKKNVEKNLEVFLLLDDIEKKTKHFTVNNVTKQKRFDEIKVDQISFFVEKQGNMRIFLSNSTGVMNERMNSLTFPHDLDCHGDCIMISNTPVFPDGIEEDDKTINLI